MKKVISVVIPVFNEEKNIPLIYQRVVDLFSTRIIEYEYRILFVDNASTDSSRKLIKELSRKDTRVQYIFNVKNFGFSRSTFYGLSQSQGDCSVLLFADLQDFLMTALKEA